MFLENRAILRDGYEHDYDGFTMREFENYYTIASADYQKIVSLITDEYKNTQYIVVLKNKNDNQEIGQEAAHICPLFEQPPPLAPLRTVRYMLIFLRFNLNVKPIYDESNPFHRPAAE
jgi:hypothetical protein